MKLQHVQVVKNCENFRTASNVILQKLSTYADTLERYKGQKLDYAAKSVA